LVLLERDLNEKCFNCFGGRYLVGLSAEPASACGSCVITPVSYTGGLTRNCDGVTKFIANGIGNVTGGSIVGQACIESPGSKASNVACISTFIQPGTQLSGTGSWTSTDSHGSTHNFVTTLQVTCLVNIGGHLTPVTTGWQTPIEVWKCT